MSRHASVARISASALTVALLLGGCGAGPDLAPRAAGELQQAVLEVTRAVADGQLEIAAVLLADVRRELVVAADEGDVSATRYRMIDDALTATEAELAAAQQAAAEQAAAVQAAAEQAAAEQSATEQAAAEQAAVDRALAEQEAAAGQNDGKGSGKGGRGEDKGDD